MKTKKDRRNSGRMTVYSYDEDYPTQFEYWDEWGSYRDGQRDIWSDKSRIKKYERVSSWMNHSKAIQQNNKKIRRLEEIKRLRKISKYLNDKKKNVSRDIIPQFK